jgi:hypothetical protein
MNFLKEFSDELRRDISASADENGNLYMEVGGKYGDHPIQTKYPDLDISDIHIDAYEFNHGCERNMVFKYKGQLYLVPGMYNSWDSHYVDWDKAYKVKKVKKEIEVYERAD